MDEDKKKAVVEMFKRESKPKPKRSRVPRQSGTNMTAGRDIKVRIGPAESQCRRCGRNQEYQVQLYRQAITALIPGVVLLAGAAQFDVNVMAAMLLSGVGFVVLAFRSVAAADGKLHQNSLTK